MSHLQTHDSRGLLLLLRDRWESCTQGPDGKVQPRKHEFLLGYLDRLPVKCLDKRDQLMRDTVLSCAPGIAWWFQHTRLPNFIDLLDRDNPSWLLFFDKFQNDPMTELNYDLWISYFKRLAMKRQNILSHLTQYALEGQAPSRIASTTAILNQFLADQREAEMGIFDDLDSKDPEEVVAEKVLLVPVRQGSHLIELRDIGADDTWFIPDLLQSFDPRGDSPDCLHHCRDKLPLVNFESVGLSLENQRQFSRLCGKSRSLSRALRTTCEARGPTKYDVVRDFRFHRRIPALISYLRRQVGSLNLPEDTQPKLEDIEIRFGKEIYGVYSIKTTDGRERQIFELPSESPGIQRSQGSKIVVCSLEHVPSAAGINQILVEAIMAMLSVPSSLKTSIQVLLATPLGSLPGKIDALCPNFQKFDPLRLGIPCKFSSNDRRGKSPEKLGRERDEEKRGRRGESFMNRWFQDRLQDDWDPSINWTSHLRHHKDEGFPEFTASECEYADFTYIDTEGKVARILAEQPELVVGMIPPTLDIRKATYHFEVKATRWSCNEVSMVSAFQYHLAEYCSTHRNAAGLLRNVYVVVRVHDFKIEADDSVTGKMKFLIDPWVLKAEGRLRFSDADMDYWPRHDPDRELRVLRYSVTLRKGEQRVTRKPDRPQSFRPAVENPSPADSNSPIKTAAKEKDST